MALNVRTLCLAILSMRDATGYEIRKLVTEGAFSHFIAASYGAIYPALAQLLADGLVTMREEEQTGKPARKVYSITPSGQRALADALATLPGRDIFKSEFLLQMMFADRLLPRQLAAIYDAYIAMQEAELAQLKEESRNLPQTPGACFVQDYGRLMLTTVLDFLKGRRDRLLDECSRAAQPENEEEAS